MGTLYDLLGALPDDDAEGLRVAFRRAAKATHPDTNPDNPDAALRFRQLVRAHDILSDAEQRETYDQLLAIANRPPEPPWRAVVYEKMHRFATNTMAATVIAAVLMQLYRVLASRTDWSLMKTPSAQATTLASVTVSGPPFHFQVSLLEPLPATAFLSVTAPAFAVSGARQPVRGVAGHAGGGGSI